MIYSVAAWEVQFLISTGPKVKVKIPFNRIFHQKNFLRLETFFVTCLKDDTTVEFTLEKGSTVVASNCLTDEIIRSGIVSESYREKLIRYCNELIPNIMEEQLKNNESGQAPKVQWTGCRRG